MNRDVHSGNSLFINAASQPSLHHDGSMVERASDLDRTVNDGMSVHDEQSSQKTHANLAFELFEGWDSQSRADDCEWQRKTHFPGHGISEQLSSDHRNHH
jgi:hypothetical protein